MEMCYSNFNVILLIVKCYDNVKQFWILLWKLTTGLTTRLTTRLSSVCSQLWCGSSCVALQPVIEFSWGRGVWGRWI